jgi:hypothetical protein
MLFDMRYDTHDFKRGKLNGLVMNEHLVPGDYDDYKIPVSVYIP